MTAGKLRWFRVGNEKYFMLVSSSESESRPVSVTRTVRLFNRWNWRHSSSYLPEPEGMHTEIYMQNCTNKLLCMFLHIYLATKLAWACQVCDHIEFMLMHIFMHVNDVIHICCISWFDAQFCIVCVCLCVCVCVCVLHITAHMFILVPKSRSSCIFEWCFHAYLLPFCNVCTWTCIFLYIYMHFSAYLL